MEGKRVQNIPPDSQCLCNEAAHSFQYLPSMYRRGSLSKLLDELYSKKPLSYKVAVDQRTNDSVATDHRV